MVVICQAAHRRMRGGFIATVLALAALPAAAQSVTIPYVFSAGSPARAADINANFSVLATAANSSSTALSALRGTVQTLQNAQGAALTFRGSWVSTAYYTPNDVVSRSGSSYLALLSGAGVDPVNEATNVAGKWALLAQRGQDGAAGVAGPQGAAGAPGSTGTQGPAGAQGAAGPIGLTGATGPQGTPGAQGVAGTTGSMGPVGTVGSAGPMGPAGATGSLGPAGPQGPAGPVGPVGATGAAGTAGAPGVPGSPGAAGPQGPAGPVGADGAPGRDGVGILTSEDKTSTGVGLSVLLSNKEGRQNTATGVEALSANVSGSDNAAFGYQSLVAVNGSGNIAVGSGAGLLLKKGDQNIYLGNPGSDAEDGVIRIGTDGQQTRAFIAGVFNATTDGKASAVVVDQFGQLGTVSSSRRYKDDIQPMAAASERVLALRPVTFRYKKATPQGERPIQYGLIAEEVAEVFPELVVYNKAGQPETVAYHLLAPLLLNELQKEHRVNERNAQLLATQQQLLETLQRKLGELEMRPAHAAVSGGTRP